MSSIVDPRLDIWVDFIYCHSGDLWEEISEAIENAHVVLFLITKEYQSSKSCRQEVMYARDTLKKRFIPIYLKKDYVASSWLGIRIAGPQYIPFGKRSFGDTLTEIVNMIIDDGSARKVKTPMLVSTNAMDLSGNPPDQPVRLLVNTSLDRIKSLEQWTVEEIDAWFDRNKIESKLKHLYQFQHGTDLLLYGQCLRTDWQHEYTDLRERYGREYDETLYRYQFVRFVGALHRLQFLH